MGDDKGRARRQNRSLRLSEDNLPRDPPVTDLDLSEFMYGLDDDDDLDPRFVALMRLNQARENARRAETGYNSSDEEEDAEDK